MSRRDARRHAFFLIYQIPFHQPCDAEILADNYALYAEGLPESERPTGRDVEYIARALGGTLAGLNEIDGMISSYLKDWQLERINKIDLAILRLGVYELLREANIPVGATVNEAVELAKEYGTDDSSAFVNGVLSGVSRAHPKPSEAAVGVSVDE